MKQHDLSYWEDLAERYFQAETSEQEEAELRKFLCSNAARDPRFDEIRATMSFLHVSRQKSVATSSFPLWRRAVEQKHSPKGGAGRGLVLAAAAACLFLAAFLGWHQYQQHNMNCVRIAGKETEADASLLMQQQMTEMFNPIDQSDR